MSEPTIFDALEYEKRFECRKWANEIPYLKFKTDWDVKIIPAFNGAIVRFFVKTDIDHISVYLDCYDILGSVGQPYWEAFPINGETERFLMDDTDGLLAAIEDEVNRNKILKQEEVNKNSLRIKKPEKFIVPVVIEIENKKETK